MSPVGSRTAKGRVATTQGQSVPDEGATLVRATGKQLPISPRKMNLVAALVRRRSVADAAVILQHTPKHAASLLADVLKSAAANASNNHGLDSKTLEISDILVTPGGVRKGFRAGARGRADPQHHRRVNVTVVVRDKEIEEKINPPKLSGTKPKEGSTLNKFKTRTKGRKSAESLGG